MQKENTIYSVDRTDIDLKFNPIYRRSCELYYDYYYYYYHYNYYYYYNYYCYTSGINTKLLDYISIGNSKIVCISLNMPLRSHRADQGCLLKRICQEIDLPKHELCVWIIIIIICTGGHARSVKIGRFGCTVGINRLES